MKLMTEKQRQDLLMNGEVSRVMSRNSEDGGGDHTTIWSVR